MSSGIGSGIPILIKRLWAHSDYGCLHSEGAAHLIDTCFGVDLGVGVTGKQVLERVLNRTYVRLTGENVFLCKDSLPAGMYAEAIQEIPIFLKALWNKADDTGRIDSKSALNSVRRVPGYSARDALQLLSNKRYIDFMDNGKVKLNISYSRN